MRFDDAGANVARGDMSRDRPVAILRVVLAAMLLLAGTPLLAQDDDAGGWHEAPGVGAITGDDRLYGRSDARFSLIIWLDPECPYCKLLGDKPEHVVDTSAGRVNLVVRLYPLPFHGPNAVLASTTALCVAEQSGAAGFYRFLNGWMAKTGGNGRGIAAVGIDDPVASLAASAGAKDANALAGCTASDRIGRKLAAEMRAAELAGIEGTPQIALRDNRVGHTITVSGAIGEDDMVNAVRVLGEFDDHPGAAGTPGGTARR